jgi:coenzyme F420 hydrogenase subunit beta
MSLPRIIQEGLVRPKLGAKDMGKSSQGFSRRIQTLQDVVDWGLCTGCGACYYACSRQGISLVNIEEVGIRPRFDSAACAGCRDCLAICPGYFVNGELAAGQVIDQAEVDPAVGPALEVWEGYASDPEIRYQGSSGGVLSALALYCLEQENMDFVLHTAMDEAKPWANQTVQSRNRRELLARTGSRYAPASPCDGLGLIEASARPCVFIGKPCDTAAVVMLRNQRPELDRKLGLVLTFFCAGTPSTQGTLDLLKGLDISPAEVAAVRYRGAGWPGEFKVRSRNEVPGKSLSYAESWGRLNGYRPLRCHLCPDGLGRVADISCGDAWERLNHAQDAGRSSVVVRTRRGQEILRKARAAKYVELESAGISVVRAAQPNQIQRNRELLGRLLGMRLLLVPTPRFVAFSLRSAWGELPFVRKVSTVLGTLRRVVLRGLFRRRPLLGTMSRVETLGAGKEI